MNRFPRKLLAGLSSLLAVALLATGCSRVHRATAAEKATDAGPAAELRLGYFPNFTHAAALIGMQQGFFAKELGKTKLSPAQFTSGPIEVGALLGNSLDAAFIGSGPAITAFSKSDGDAVRLIAGATSRGAQLVVGKGINSPADLKGKTLATPQVGNTQDVAAKKWLSQQNLTGQVKVTSMDNAQTLNALRSNQIQAAWLPEPWSSRLVLDAGAHVLVDESTLWPQGQFPTTVLVVRTDYLHSHPETVRALLRGELDSINYASADPTGAKKAVNTQLTTLTGKPLSSKVIDRAWSDITLTTDPIAARFPALSHDQVTGGLVAKAPAVAGMADLTLLNQLLSQAHRPPVSSAGLDTK